MALVRKNIGPGSFVEYDRDEYDQWIKNGARPEESPVRQIFEREGSYCVVVDRSGEK
jgi:hypothetical protein